MEQSNKHENLTIIANEFCDFFPNEVYMEKDPLEEVIKPTLSFAIESKTIHENDERMKISFQKITFSKILLETS